MKTDKSKGYFKKSESVLVGGVNSPVRAFGAVGGTPLFIKRAKEAVILDEDGNRYIDFVGSWGPLILGHAHPKIVKVISKMATLGSSYGAPTKIEYLLAKKVTEAFPSIEKIRFVNSGTEALQSAIRLARGCTGRDKIVKFEGGYHGHSDSLLVRAGSGGATYGVPTSQGIPKDIAKQTTVLPFNDEQSVLNLFKENGQSIAAIVIEPIAANMGVILPADGFLKLLRKCCDQYGALLIFDEVISGFRVAYGGAQEKYGIRADITCLGKIIGGGLPVGAYGGAKKIMDEVSPTGGVYQAGTLSGNPLAMAAGLETLNELSKPRVYKRLYERTAFLCLRLEKIIEKTKIPVKLNWATGLFTLFFNKQPVVDFKTANQCDLKTFSKYFHFMLSRGIYLPPSQFEANFISLSHTKKQLETFLGVAQKFLMS